MQVALLTGFLALLSTPIEEGQVQKLFVIERSENRNEVHYDALFNHNGTLLEHNPIRVYWIMREQGDQREPLTWFEERFAYGISVVRDPRAKHVSFNLAALEGRTVDVVSLGGSYIARVEINGRASRLERVFVKLKQGGLSPAVRHIDIVGTDLLTGKKLRERIEP